MLISNLAYIHSQEKLEVDGAIVIGESEDPNPAPGTIRWDGLNFQGYNGFMWIVLGPFQTTSGVTDIDGNEYSSVTIGNQEWMAQNLRVATYRNGDAIPNISNQTNWDNLTSGAYCWYDNDSSYEEPYGKLYNWYAVDDSRGLCPTDWHGPTEADFEELQDFVSESTGGGKMKDIGFTYWNIPNTGATNETGFTGLPGGWRVDSFIGLGSLGNYWLKNLAANNNGLSIALYSFNSVLFQDDPNPSSGLSIRCIRDY